MADIINPVLHFCFWCGWAWKSELSTSQKCRRCGKLEKMSLAVPARDFQEFTINREAETPLLNKKSVKPVKNIDRTKKRSRAFDRQFVLKLGKETAPERSVVNTLVDLSLNYKSESAKVIDALEKILTVERMKESKWRDIADETIIELIVNDVNVFNFVSALIRTYSIDTYEFGQFIATPYDKDTMSLIEEAVCQESIELFLQTLRMDQDLQRGVLECKDVVDGVRKEIFDLLDRSSTQIRT